MQYIRGKRCAVVGLGVSNRPLIGFLLMRGAIVCARDRKTREELSEVIDELEKQGATFKLGEDYLDGLDEEIIFRSPGMRPDIPEFAAAVERGAVLTSEMELFFELTPATVIGITGSDGKTTSTTLTGLILSQEYKDDEKTRIFVGGNIGTPLLPMVADMTERDFAVVELSSFQLQDIKHSPHVTAVTNVTPNHLNWHTGMDEYTEAKANGFRYSPCRRAVLNAENRITAELAKNADVPVTYFSSKKESYTEFPLKDGDSAVYVRDGKIYLWYENTEREIMQAAQLLLRGRHNLENLMTAIALTFEYASPESVREVATTFTGVKHRMEPVRVSNGVTYYDSSIDSTPVRTAAVLSAMPAKPIVICGGSDKGTPYEPLADAICEYAKAAVITGATAGKILTALSQKNEVQEGKIPVYLQPDFGEAVKLACTTAQEGDIVLLSPACASFDAFKNYKERGMAFRAIIEQY
jgi:UDP-N-acetylmuramoylalanine--D-glutamate ligase